MDRIPVSKRCKQIDASGIRKVFDLAARRRAEGADLIDLSIGQPDFPVPDEIKQSAIESIQSDRNSYSVTQGIEELRSMVGNQYRSRFGILPEGVMITSGVSGGLVLSLLATCQNGDEVIVIDPYFVMYKHLVTLSGATSVIVDSYPDFNLPIDKISDAVTSRTKILLLNSPSNPTGCLYSEDELKEAAKLAKRHDLLIISDEIYRDLSYDGAAPSVVKYAPDRTLLLDGFSKNYALTGWRLGTAAGPKILIEQMAKLQQYTFVCAPTPFQYAALASERCDMSEIIKDYGQRRDLIYNGLKKEFNVVKPGGGFYIFPEAPGGDAEEFCRKALEKDVLIIPGNVFSEKNTHFRISYARDVETLQAGVKRLNDIARKG